MKKHAIITASDGKYGNFLVHQWLRSLTEQVNLSTIDIVVIDYGLTTAQVKFLNEKKVHVIPGITSGHIVVSRFIDAGIFLEKTSYDQVLCIDSGDIVFQTDISPLFESNRHCFRVNQLDLEVFFFEAFISNNFLKDKKQVLWQRLKNKPVLNAGVLFAPRTKFISLCKQVGEFVDKKNAYGSDQIVVNYVIYNEKFVLLENKYNFRPVTQREHFFVKDGIFYFTTGEKISIVHNAGHDSFLRPIKNFGYGRGYNQLKPGVYYSLRGFYTLLGVLRKLRATK